MVSEDTGEEQIILLANTGPFSATCLGSSPQLRAAFDQQDSHLLM